MHKCNCNSQIIKQLKEHQDRIHKLEILIGNNTVNISDERSVNKNEHTNKKN